MMRPGELRARLRPIATNERDRLCGVKASSLYPTVQVRREADGPHARFTGLMLCGHIWSCPVCSRVLRAERASRIEGAVRGSGGWWVILTITIRHKAGGDLREQLRGLLAAWRRARQGGALQRIWTAKVSASVRATECTHGCRHGWHPHIHVLLRSKEWTSDERAVLFQRWHAAVLRELGEAALPTAAHGLDFTDVFDAATAPTRYLTKLGLELTGTAKEGKRGSRTPWELAQDAADGDPQSVKLWRDFVDATKGHQMIRLDDRAQTHAKWFALMNAIARDDEFDGPSPVREFELWPEEVAALRRGERRHPTLLEDVLRDAETTEDPEGALRRWVSWSSAAEGLHGLDDQPDHH